LAKYLADRSITMKTLPVHNQMRNYPEVKRGRMEF
jgi:hypothetical protein